MGMAAKGRAPSIAARFARTAASVAVCGTGRVCALSRCASSPVLRGRSPVAIGRRLCKRGRCRAQQARGGGRCRWGVRLPERFAFGSVFLQFGLPTLPPIVAPTQSKFNLEAEVRALPGRNRELVRDCAGLAARTLRRRIQGVGRTRGKWCVPPGRPLLAPRRPLASPAAARELHPHPPPKPFHGAPRGLAPQASGDGEG